MIMNYILCHRQFGLFREGGVGGGCKERHLGSRGGRRAAKGQDGMIGKWRHPGNKWIKSHQLINYQTVNRFKIRRVVLLLPLRTPGHGGAWISIPRVILDSLPLGAEEHMWISHDRTQRLTAQRRRRLSSDVMHLSSPGESQQHGWREKMKSYVTLLSPDSLEKS